MPRAIRTVLIDENSLFREGLRRILLETPFRVVRHAGTCDEFLEGSPEKTAPGLMLLGAGADDWVTASEVRRFKECYPNARVVVLSDHCDFDGVLSILEAGANGYVLKQVDHGTLTKSLDLVMLGETVLSSSVIELFTRQSKPGNGGQRLLEGPARQASEAEYQRTPRKFSNREAEILDCLTRGEANKLIARKFDITEATVKVHIKAILRKIQVKNRTQAAIWAHANLPSGRRDTAYQSRRSHDGCA